MRLVDRPAKWTGRVAELATLRVAVEALRRGEGSVVWVEGEPGIGKSALVAEALAVSSDPGWDIGWGAADPLTERLPLWVMQDCLAVRPGSADRRRAQAAQALRGGQLALLADGDPPVAGIEELVRLADELCATAPLVMVVDDVQWADDASLIALRQLAASIDQTRMLLIATCRLAPHRARVRELRTAIARHGGAVITLGPLPDADVTALVTMMLGVPPGDTLRRLTAQAAGNPLYLRELVDALVREQAVLLGPSAAEVAVSPGQLPGSLAAVLGDRLTSVSAETAQMLRSAALLGGTFAVTDLAVLLGKPASALAPSVQEAVAVGILAGAGPDLIFRHPLIRQALYESMPAALRKALHAEAARGLAAVGADVLSVAQQLSAAGAPDAGWARDWLLEAAPVLTTRAPQLAVGLLRREVRQRTDRGQAWEGFTASLSRALLAAGSYPESASQASQALALMTDPVRRAETYWVLVRAQLGEGDADKAIGTLRQALTRTDLPPTWQARMLALQAMLERGGTGDLNAADATARRSLSVAEEAGDAFAVAHALIDLGLSHGVRRDHATALGCIDRAARVLGDDPGAADLRSLAFDCRVFTLQNLDRWPEAELTVRQARESARRDGRPDSATWVNAAVLRYWLGQWDDALAELGSADVDVPGLTYSGLRGRERALLVSGVAALIAGRRNQRSEAARLLDEGLELPIEEVFSRENRDFLAAAHAVALEQRGETRQAMAALAALLPRRDDEMTLIHQWLPDLVRLAIAAGDRDLARAAVRACEAEAAAETPPARAVAASLRCAGLLSSDPAPIQEAVAHYRTVGPAAQLPDALEDLAVVLAMRGQGEEARAALNEAVARYDAMEAHWDIRRAYGRLRPCGIRRGARGPRGPRPTSGWEALTPTEVKIAVLVGAGESTSDIAMAMFLSRRTVQKHISSILAKLGAKGRVDIVREVVLHQGITA
jgi:DNA-binding CsgD family transcriptional regulator/tetratricopeptide (TPR) repeat protein